MTTKKTDKTDEPKQPQTADETAPEAVVPVEDQGIGPQDPYPSADSEEAKK